MTLNHFDNSASDHLTITAGQLFGPRPELAPNGQISGRRRGGDHHAGLPAMTYGRSVDLRRETINRAINGGPPEGHLGVIVRRSCSDRQLACQIWAQI